MEQNDNTLEDLEKRIYDLKNLINLGMSLSSNLNFQSLVESILYACIGQFFVERVAILLQVDLDIPDLHVHMTKGYDAEPDKDVCLKENSPLYVYLDAHPEPVTIEKLNELPFSEEMERLKYLTPSLIVPMKSKNSLNGLLILGDKMSGEQFSFSEKEFIQNLSKFAAIAVENSQLYLMAILDRMTRLYIHHYFQERLAEEISRSKRSESPLSLIMSDIDHFKNFNDTYGHQQGDIVLKKTAEIFKKQVRNVDIAARYGGEEFAIILPNTKLDEAILVANRLRKAVEKYEYPGQEIPIHVTISFGVAQFNPDKDMDSQHFLKRSDNALYKAKELGRNRVVAFE